MSASASRRAHWLSWRRGIGLIAARKKVRVTTGAALAYVGAEAGAVVVNTSGLDARVKQVQPVLRGLIGPRLRVAVHDAFGQFAGVDGVVPILARAAQNSSETHLGACP